LDTVFDNVDRTKVIVLNLDKLPTCEDVKPIEAYLNSDEDTCLAIIVGVDGPSYRPLGAMMTLFATQNWVGTLSSGCIESDLNLHAKTTFADKSPKLVRYGQGSPFIDIQLPCGGGMDVLLLPNPDEEVLKSLQAHLKRRIPCSLMIDIPAGILSLQQEGATERDGDKLCIRYEPEPMFLIFGKGPEASTFSALVTAAGYPSLLLSPDDGTLAKGEHSGCQTRHLSQPIFPTDLDVDHRTAIVLFFHDHDWEPDILIGALQTKAFYIGAQGSRAARASRLAEMRGKGVLDSQLQRLSGQVGLIPSTRDAKTLAVSVLAEILLKAT
jgi:xanthine dehydrogenase accessory factor